MELFVLFIESFCAGKVLQELNNSSVTGTVARSLWQLFDFQTLIFFFMKVEYVQNSGETKSGLHFNGRLLAQRQ